MEFIRVVLPYAQILFAVVLITSVLLQQHSASVGGALGSGDNSSASFSKRRGAELFLFRTTIVVGVLFVVAILASLKV